MKKNRTLIVHIEVYDESMRTAEHRENFFKGYISSIPGLKVIQTEIK